MNFYEDTQKLIEKSLWSQRVKQFEHESIGDSLGKELNKSLNETIRKIVLDHVVFRLKLRALDNDDDMISRGYRQALRHCRYVLETDTNFVVTGFHNYIKYEILQLERSTYEVNHDEDSLSFIKGHVTAWYTMKEYLEQFFVLDILADQEFNTKRAKIIKGSLSRDNIPEIIQEGDTTKMVFNFGHETYTKPKETTMNELKNNNYRIVIELGDDTYQVLFDNENGVYFFFELCEHDYIFMTRDELYTFVSGTKTFHDDIAQRFFDMNELSFVIERFLETDDEYILIARDALFCEE